MRIQVTRVNIPEMSTIGYGWGTTTDGQGHIFDVEFVGDHRPMRHLGEQIVEADDPVSIDIEEWQLMKYSQRPIQ